MKKLTIAALLLISVTGFSQSFLCLAKAAGSKEWGYINEKGEFVIPPRAGKLMEFSSDGIAVYLPAGSKQYQFIKPDGSSLSTEVSNFRLMEFFGFGVKGFNNGFAPVKIGEQWGFLDTKGKLAIQAKYDDVTEFFGGYSVGKKGNSFFVVSKDGSEKPVENDQTKDVKHFSEGLAPYYTLDKRAGFIDANGAIVIRAQYLSVGYFSNGLAWAKTTDNKVGYINKTGAWAINPQFESCNEFDPSTGMAVVRAGKQKGYINDKGQPLNMSLEGYGEFADGLCWGKQGIQVGFFDKTGNWVIAPQFAAVRDFKNGYAAAKQGELWGVIDKKGNWVVKPTFDAVRDMERVN